MAITLFLVRHGQTTANVANALDSALPGPELTELGWEQARAVAADLAERDITAVYASRAIRAQQTGSVIGEKIGVLVQTLVGVHEVFVGDLDSRTDQASFAEFVRVFQAWGRGELDEPMPGGESAADVLTRFTIDINEIVARHEDGNIVIVSHGAAIRLVASNIVDNVTLMAGARAILPNTGKVVLEQTEAGWTCSYWEGISMR
jgi:probable phosphoglycerate mutase